MLAIVLATRAHALPDELEVYLDETTAQGRTAVDVISNYTVSGPRRPSDEGLRPSFHLLQVNPDFSYGVTSHSQVDLQLFSSVDVSGNSRVDGGRLVYLSVPIRSGDEDGDGLFVGNLFEVGHLPRTLSRNNIDGEVFLLLGYRAGRWTFATNPEIDLKISGHGSSEPAAAAKFKAAFRTNQGYAVGVEHYGDLGQLRHLGPLKGQSQQTFAVVDFKARAANVNIGIGRGWTDVAERWVLKAIVSFPFGN